MNTQLASRIFGTALTLLSAIVSLPASGSMLGDSLTFERLYPDLNTQFVEPRTIVAVAGSSDAFTLQTYDIFDPEANDISIHWLASSRYAGIPPVFDGFRVSGFSGTIQSVVATDVANIQISELAFGDHFVTINLNSPFDTTSFVNLHFEFAPVPLPAAGWIFAPAVAVLCRYRRRRSI